ncbi:hypothetical protein LCGC14_2058950, partial [marine sediment metagenome]
RKQLPQSCVDVLGNTNARIINTLITDLLNYSLDNDVIGYSDATFKALKELKAFNYENIYTRRDTKVISYETFVKKLKSNFKLIFTSCLNDLEGDNYESPIFRDHIEYIDDKNYITYFKPLKESKQLTLIVRDYIAGMSDKYFREIFEWFN